MNHMAASSHFVFLGHEENITQGTIRFRYELAHVGVTHTFVETFSFDPTRVAPTRCPSNVINRILDALLLILGMSYWKTYCPKKLVLEGMTLTPKQAAFWNTVYTKGLGEFYYRNKIDFRMLVQFPHSRNEMTSAILCPRKDRSLVQLGGGKDSIVTAELLKAAKKPFSLITIAPHRVQESVAGEIGEDYVPIVRMMDTQLFELNKRPGVTNGHIPISAMYAFVDLLCAALFDYRYIIASNEESASYGNVSYLGEEINHQWSKSFEFERLFREYVHEYITPDIQYFSLLRPWKEIKIVKEFTKYPQYFPLFSSCNKNFRQQGKAEKLWCGECPKCAFVFLMLAAFLPKEKVVAILNKNLFTDERLLVLFRELLGFEGIKPFECVGNPDEAQYALWRVGKTGDYDTDPVFVQLKTALAGKWSEIEASGSSLLIASPIHAIPQDFREVIL